MPEEDIIKKLKKLSPKERAEKLKELQKKDKEEIEQAQKLLQETEEEITRQEEVEKIPIPQLKSVDIGALFSPEEKELFKAKRFATESPKEEENEETKPAERAELERIAEEAPRLSQEEAAAQAQYLDQLSQKPAEELYNKIKSIYQEVKASGEITPNQMNDLNTIEYANRRKMHDIQAGKYTEVTQETAREMILTEKMKSWLQESYGR